MIERIIFGCHNLTGGSSYWRSKHLVDAALSAGIRRFDVAPCYGLGTAERTLARALGPRRQDVQITTKFGILPPPWGWAAALLREPYRRLRRAGPASQPGASRSHSPTPHDRERRPREFPLSATAALGRSCRALGLERLDGLLVHERIDGGFALRLADELAELKARGRIAHWGVSGSLQNVRDMIGLCGAPDIVQVALGDAAELGAAPQLRLFNLLRAAPRDLRPADGPAGHAGADLAIVLAGRARRVLGAQAHASVLFNTTTAVHLERFVRALSGRHERRASRVPGFSSQHIGQRASLPASGKASSGLWLESGGVDRQRPLSERGHGLSPGGAVAGRS